MCAKERFRSACAHWSESLLGALKFHDAYNKDSDQTGWCDCWSVQMSEGTFSYIAAQSMTSK